YRLRAVLGSSTSPYSGLIGVTTVSTGTAPVHHLSYKIGTSPAGIHIYDLKGSEIVKLYSVTGSLQTNQRAVSGTLTLTVQTRGIFILQISDGRNTETYKIVR
ncbi:MAG TPA: T9SS type A sorting domain-containing protein, partial [Paludibacteraceae bacterium]|nr:T9SS type A sorting domain-containing protein [Paludibacteraceae bacterium]